MMNKWLLLTFSLAIFSAMSFNPAQALRVKNMDKEARTLYITTSNQTEAVVLEPYEMHYIPSTGVHISLDKNKPGDFSTQFDQEYVIWNNELEINRYYRDQNR